MLIYWVKNKISVIKFKAIIRIKSTADYLYLIKLKVEVGYKFATSIWRCSCVELIISAQIVNTNPRLHCLSEAIIFFCWTYNNKIVIVNGEILLLEHNTIVAR